MTRDNARTPAAVRLLLVLFPLLSGLYALAVGQDANWDLRNYHFYIPYAFLADRMGYDVAVSHLATYYNPLLHVPFYLAVQFLSPKAVGFALGMIPAFNAFLVYAIAVRAAGGMLPASWIPWVALAAALAGMLGHNGLSEAGTSYGDNFLSLAVLAAVWLILRFRHRIAAPGRPGWLVVLASGVLAGSAFGMKLPFAVYCVGLCLAFFAFDMPWRRRFQMAFGFGIGVLAGAALTGGFWMLEMYRRFDNPLFPYFNEVFKSPWAAAGSYRDERFIPPTLLKWLVYPIWFNIHPWQVGEVAFRDLRFAVVYLLLIVAAARGVYRRIHPASRSSEAAGVSGDPLSATGFLVAFAVVSFLAWMKLFGVYRYIIVCEQLAPLLIFLLLAVLVSAPRRLLYLTAAVFALILVTLKPGDWGRKPWTQDYFGFTPPPLSEPASTLVLVTGYEPMGYMVPFFPPEVRFLRIQGYMTGPSPTPNLTDRQMQDAIAGHTGPFYLVYRSFERQTALDVLEAFGMAMGSEPCRELTAAIEPKPEFPFYFCRVHKK